MVSVLRGSCCCSLYGGRPVQGSARALQRRQRLGGRRPERRARQVLHRQARCGAVVLGCDYSGATFTHTGVHLCTGLPYHVLRGHHGFLRIELIGVTDLMCSLPCSPQRCPTAAFRRIRRQGPGVPSGRTAGADASGALGSGQGRASRTPSGCGCDTGSFGLQYTSRACAAKKGVTRTEYGRPPAGVTSCDASLVEQSCALYESSPATHRCCVGSGRGTSAR